MIFPRRGFSLRRQDLPSKESWQPVETGGQVQDDQCAQEFRQGETTKAGAVVLVEFRWCSSWIGLKEKAVGDRQLTEVSSSDSTGEQIRLSE